MVVDRSGDGLVTTIHYYYYYPFLGGCKAIEQQGNRAMVYGGGDDGDSCYGAWLRRFFVANCVRGSTAPAWLSG